MILQRLVDTKNETFGVFFDDSNIPFAVTLEDSWRNNQHGISCIPVGIYTCKRVVSPKFGNVFEIINVINRSHILIHWGNRDTDTQGCILVGEEFGEIDGKPAILTSKSVPGKGFNEFMNKNISRSQFTLDIRGPVVL